MNTGGTNRTRKSHSWVAAAAALWIITIVGTGCASIQPRADIAHVAYGISAAADMHTTEQALAAGGQEINPLLGSDPSVAKVAALKTAGFIGLRSIETSWERKLGRGLKWYEKVLLWGLPIGLQTFAALNNSQVARR